MRIGKNKQGSTIIAAVIMATIVGVVVLGLAKILNENNHQAVYFSTIKKVHRWAETGANDALLRLIKDSDVHHFDPNAKATDPISGATYQSSVAIRTQPTNPAYYIQTTSTLNLGGHPYIIRLHSYARVSNAGEYFAAIKNDLEISKGANLGAARVYAGGKLTFDQDLSIVNQTQVLCAEFSREVSPDITGVTPINTIANNDWPQSVKNEIFIPPTCQPHGCPVKLPNEILFPQIFSSDLADWKTKADSAPIPFGVTHVQTGPCIFSGDICPPGYSGTEGVCGANPDTNDAHHIYYCDGNLYVQGQVHGQILFVSNADIHISGNLVPSLDATFPGQANPIGSKAHQAVLIAAGNIVIDSNDPNPENPGNQLKVCDTLTGVTQTVKDDQVNYLCTSAAAPRHQREYIHALLMAPNGLLTVQPYTSQPNIQDELGIDFTGTMILRKMDTSPNTIPNVFRWGSDVSCSSKDRSYSYDSGFSAKPPPFLPALAEVYYVMEEFVSGGVNFN